MFWKSNVWLNHLRGTRSVSLFIHGQVVAIFLTCLLIYIITLSGHHYSIDGVVMFQYAKALLFDHSFFMEPPVRWGSDFTVGHWPIGLSIFYMPILAFLSLTFFRGDNSISKIPFNPDLTHNPALLENRPYLYSSVLNPMITAFSAVILYLLCLRLGFSPKKAAAAALVFALASPATAYAKFDFAQPLASLFLLLTFLFLLRARDNSYINLVVAGISFGIVILARTELLLLTPIFLAAIFFMQNNADPKPKSGIHHPIKNLLSFGLPVIVFFLINQSLNYSRFGSWFSIGYNPGSEFELNLRSVSMALIGNLISPGRGILLFYPLSILSWIGLRKLFHTDRWLAWVFTTFIFGSLLLYSTWKDWGAGLSWGPRFFIPILPYLTLLAFLGFDALEKYPKFIRFALIGMLIIIGAMIALKGSMFNFLGFYGTLDLSPQVITQGDYNFLPQYSPLLTGWGNFTLPGNYDIYWLQNKNIQTSNSRTLIVIFIGLIAIGYLLRFWLDFFSNNPPQAQQDFFDRQ